MDDKILKPNRRLLNWSGFWPGGPKKTPQQMFRCVFYMSVNLFVIILAEFYFIVVHIGDMIEVLQCVSEILSIALCFFKMVLVLYYRKQLQKLVNEMQDVWEKSIYK